MQSCTIYDIIYAIGLTKDRNLKFTVFCVCMDYNRIGTGMAEGCAESVISEQSSAFRRRFCISIVTSGTALAISEQMRISQGGLMI